MLYRVPQNRSQWLPLTPSLLSLPSKKTLVLSHTGKSQRHRGDRVGWECVGSLPYPAPNCRWGSPPLWLSGMCQAQEHIIWIFASFLFLSNRREMHCTQCSSYSNVVVTTLIAILHQLTNCVNWGYNGDWNSCNSPLKVVQHHCSPCQGLKWPKPVHYPTYLDALCASSK